MDRSLDSLSSEVYPALCQLIARVTARGHALMIIQTGRTPEQHQVNLAAGTSGTTFSLHLPRRLRWPSSPVPEPDKCDAIDLAPYEVYQSNGPDKISWNTKHPAFRAIGEEAEKLNLRWGGRWLKPFDPGHAELIVPWKAHLVAEERTRPFPTFDA